MIRRRLAGFLVLLAAVSAFACASFQAAQTPEQRWYAAVAEYVAVAQAGGQYCSTQPVDHPPCHRMAEIHQVASATIRTGNAAVIAGQDAPTAVIVQLALEMAAALESRED